MSAKVEDKAVEVIDKAANAVDAMTAKLATLAEKYGPEAIDAGLSVVRMNGLAEILTGTVLVIGAGIGLRYSVRAVLAGLKQHAVYMHPDTPVSAPMGMAGMLVGGISTAALGIAALSGTARLADLWNWVAIFEPKLWVVKRLLGL